MVNKQIGYISLGLIIFIPILIYLLAYRTEIPATSIAVESSEYCQQILSSNKLDITELNIEIGLESYIFSVEIADTPPSKATGLMCRSSMEEDSGMIFVFEDIDYRSFWMKNTLIPLDIIFLDENLKIINIHTNTVPLKEDIFYTSNKPAKYVLELKGGTAEKIDIKITSNITLTK